MADPRMLLDSGGYLYDVVIPDNVTKFATLVCAGVRYGLSRKVDFDDTFILIVQPEGALSRDYEPGENRIGEGPEAVTMYFSPTGQLQLKSPSGIHAILETKPEVTVSITQAVLSLSASADDIRERVAAVKSAIGPTVEPVASRQVLVQGVEQPSAAWMVSPVTGQRPDVYEATLIRCLRFPNLDQGAAGVELVELRGQDGATKYRLDAVVRTETGYPITYREGTAVVADGPVQLSGGLLKVTVDPSVGKGEVALRIDNFFDGPVAVGRPGTTDYRTYGEPRPRWEVKVPTGISARPIDSVQVSSVAPVVGRSGP